jgi:cytochrome c peroxidase
MGFDDREIVALSGAHALGRCHANHSGFEGPWTFSPTTLTNEYFKLLRDTEWRWKQWDGNRQYEDKPTGSLMMLPTDMALMKDEKFRVHVERYAEDEGVFFKEFADVVVKLLELGVPFTVCEDARMEFKRLE